MPTPIGHAVGGLATAWLAQSITGKRSYSSLLTAGCAVAAMTPDLDLLVGHHRTYTHSIGAAICVGIVTWIVMWNRRSPAAATIALTIAAAYGSHLLLDWLGKDTSTPPGLTALWPFSSQFYISGLDWFGEVSRRYWKPDEFIVGNLIAVGKELIEVGPVAAIAWLLAARTRSAPTTNH